MYCWNFLYIAILNIQICQALMVFKIFVNLNCAFKIGNCILCILHLALWVLRIGRLDTFPYINVANLLNPNLCKSSCIYPHQPQCQILFSLLTNVVCKQMCIKIKYGCLFLFLRKMRQHRHCSWYRAFCSWPVYRSGSWRWSRWRMFWW